jgi:uncharacterized membrane protein YphA (DoxX/SURF4 family)
LPEPFASGGRNDGNGAENVVACQHHESGVPEGWMFVAQPKESQTASLDGNHPAEGESSAFLDCSEGANRFTNLMQAFRADDYQGQRVRFRAAVRTADLHAATRVQLWFRVDRKDGMGAFDNMQDRPIDSDDWEHFDVVLDVAEDATRINIGMFVIGSGKAWLDDATLEIVDKKTKTTGAMMNTAAIAAAADAPTQPLYSHWLWLVFIACVLFVISQWVPSRRSEFDDDDDEEEEALEKPLGRLRKFALYFSVVYWLLYSLPSPFMSVAPFLQPLYVSYMKCSDVAVRWFAANAMGIEGELVAPNGSGDTTYAYVKVLLGFLMAVVIGLIWSRLDRRHTAGRMTKDLLRSYLRYVLAATMIGYGLAKVGFIRNQFPTPGVGRLDQAFGDASPMGLLWTFMGASRAYTMFAGMGEVVGGVLLLFRRTTTLGAMVVFGVMLNVMMMNFCYDVPVKQYSAHLVVMSLFLLLPETKRLLNVLMFNRPADRLEMDPPYTGPTSIWVQRLVKLWLVASVAIIPISVHTYQEIQHARATEKPAVADKLLMKRGFRWINEVPFNR